MKTKQLTVLAAAAALTLGAYSAHAIQKHDPIFQSVYYVPPQSSDPDLVHQVRYQAGSPHGKADLYVVRASGSGVDRDLVREMSCQKGSPKSKVDPSLQSFELAPLK